MKVVPEFKLTAEPVSDDAKSMSSNLWSASEVGSRHKIGGHPNFIQGEIWPVCADCREQMSFYGQLDSLNDKNGEFDVADCGIIYVFFCFDCNEASTVVQSY